MVTLVIQEKNIKFDKGTNTFKHNGSGIPFATTYELVNKKTGGKLKFNFKESTGSEWSESTKYIYKSENGFILEIGNGTPSEIKQREKIYLIGKLK